MCDIPKIRKINSFRQSAENRLISSFLYDKKTNQDFGQIINIEWGLGEDTISCTVTFDNGNKIDMDANLVYDLVSYGYNSEYAIWNHDPNRNQKIDNAKDDKDNETKLDEIVGIKDEWRWLLGKYLYKLFNHKIVKIDKIKVVMENSIYIGSKTPIDNDLIDYDTFKSLALKGFYGEKVGLDSYLILDLNLIGKPKITLVKQENTPNTHPIDTPSNENLYTFDPFIDNTGKVEERVKQLIGKWIVKWGTSLSSMIMGVVTDVENEGETVNDAIIAHLDSGTVCFFNNYEIDELLHQGSVTSNHYQHIYLLDEKPKGENPNEIIDNLLGKNTHIPQTSEEDIQIVRNFDDELIERIQQLIGKWIVYYGDDPEDCFYGRIHRDVTNPEGMWVETASGKLEDLTLFKDSIDALLKNGCCGLGGLFSFYLYDDDPNGIDIFDNVKKLLRLYIAFKHNGEYSQKLRIVNYNDKSDGMIRKIYLQSLPINDTLNEIGLDRQAIEDLVTKGEYDTSTPNSPNTGLVLFKDMNSREKYIIGENEN